MDSDWNASRYLTVVAGVCLVVGCWLPWMNSAGGTLGLAVPYETSGFYWPRALPSGSAGVVLGAEFVQKDDRLRILTSLGTAPIALWYPAYRLERLRLGYVPAEGFYFVTLAGGILIAAATRRYFVSVDGQSK